MHGIELRRDCIVGAEEGVTVGDECVLRQGILEGESLRMAAPVSEHFPSKVAC